MKMNFENLFWLTNELMANVNEAQRERINLLCKSEKSYTNETQKAFKRRVSRYSLWLGTSYTHEEYGDLIEQDISNYKRKSDVAEAKMNMLHDICRLIHLDFAKVISITKHQ